MNINKSNNEHEGGGLAVANVGSFIFTDSTVRMCNASGVTESVTAGTAEVRIHESS